MSTTVSNRFAVGIVGGLAALLLVATLGAYDQGQRDLCSRLTRDVAAGQLASEVVYDPASPCIAYVGARP
jgi:hypothetical protein